MKKSLLLNLAIFALAFATYAQPGVIDLTFNPSDIGNGNGDGASTSVLSTSVQSDGKIIIGGQFRLFNGTSRNYIARLNADGTLDGTFNSSIGPDQSVLITSIQNDGKIVIGGEFTFYNGISRNYIARLNVDGTLDNSFNPGTGLDDVVRTISIQSDGKIIIGGDFSFFNGISRRKIARLNADGTLDGTFDPGTGANWIVYDTAIQSDGKIIIAGDFVNYNGTAINRIARLNTNGTLDGTFNPGTGPSSRVDTASIQSDGKIIIASAFYTYDGTVTNGICRLNANGTLDSTFNVGTGINAQILTTSIQSDGKIFIGGWFTTFNGTERNYIARLNDNGTLDTSFIPGTGANSRVFTTSIQSDGHLIIGGSFNRYNGIGCGRIARLNANGTLDLPFNPGTGADRDILTTSIQSDGKIIIGGEFSFYNGIPRNYIARLNANGTLDITFNPGTGANGLIRTVAVQSNGKIIIGGDFTTYNGTIISRIARLNSNGTLDVTFNPGTGADSEVKTVSIQSDGKIIIGGDFISYNGTLRNYIVRLNVDGTPDNIFNAGPGSYGSVYTTCIQNDGKIIIGGRFTAYNGIAINRIARLNANGTLDASFNIGTGVADNGIMDSTVWTTSIQNDGKIIIGGNFTSFNGTATNGIARLNVNGTLDDTFNRTGLNDTVYTTCIQNDGKIIIGNYSLSRLNVNGSLDSSFYVAPGLNSIIFTTSIQSDGKIIMGGRFTAYSETGRNRIARINGGEQLSTLGFKLRDLFIYPNPSNGIFNIQNTDISKVKSIFVYTVLGEIIFTKAITASETTIDISGQPKGVYLYKVWNENTVNTGKLIVN